MSTIFQKFRFFFFVEMKQAEFNVPEINVPEPQHQKHFIHIGDWHLDYGYYDIGLNFVKIENF